MRVGACLSLTGRYARCGEQAAAGLQAWRGLDGDTELVVMDDGSDPARVESCLRAVAGRCDLLLGPYSTQLMRVRGPGSFGRQVIAGAAEMATTLGLRTVRLGPADALPADCTAGAWDLFCAGSFEEDVARVSAARALARQPRLIGAVAAGVREFGQEVSSAEGVYGIAQWFPGRRMTIELGPREEDFLQAYSALTGGVPDYPAVQAAATAVLATHCARAAGDVARESLWAMATALRTTTMFGAFRIDPASGAQLGHQMALVRWTANGPTAVSSISASTL